MTTRPNPDTSRGAESTESLRSPVEAQEAREASRAPHATPQAVTRAADTQDDATTGQPSPVAELRAAAEKLRGLAKAIEVNHRPDIGWHVEECADDERGNCACIVAQGTYNTGDGFVQPLFYVADAETPEIAAYITAMQPAVSAALATVFEAWARMGSYDPDLLHRVGGDETLTLARLINGGFKTGEVSA